MLCLQRKENSVTLIDTPLGPITLIVDRISSQRYRLLIDAPRGCQIYRDDAKSHAPQPSVTALTSAQLVSEYPADRDQARRVATEAEALRITAPIRAAAEEARQ